MPRRGLRLGLTSSSALRLLLAYPTVRDAAGSAGLTGNAGFDNLEPLRVSEIAANYLDVRTLAPAERLERPSQSGLHHTWMGAHEHPCQPSPPLQAESIERPGREGRTGPVRAVEGSAASNAQQASGRSVVDG